MLGSFPVSYMYITFTPSSKLCFDYPRRFYMSDLPTKKTNKCGWITSDIKPTFIVNDVYCQCKKHFQHITFAFTLFDSLIRSLDSSLCYYSFGNIILNAVSVLYCAFSQYSLILLANILQSLSKFAITGISQNENRRGL